MIPYMLHVTVLISLSFLIYKGLIARTTFYKLNRVLLLLCIFLSFCLPLCSIPQTWSLYHFIDPPANGVLKEDILHLLGLSLGEGLDQNRIQTATSFNSEVSLPQRGLYYLYFIGLLAMCLGLIRQMIGLLLLLLRSHIRKGNKMHIVELEKEIAPFSFLNFVFINPAQYDSHTLSQIFAHEKIHISQYHSLDMILAEILVVVQWFNPFAYQFRNAIENNLEFLTDQEMLNLGADRTSYQLSLFNIALPDHHFSFVSHYNHSMLRKRISMMNGKRSSPTSGWKYLIMILVFITSLSFLNATSENSIQSAGKIIEENRQISGFSKIDVNGKFRVVMRKGAKDEVLLRGFEDQLSSIETELINETLVIRALDGYKSGYHYDVLLTAKDLYGGQIIRGDADYVSETFLHGIE